MNIVQRIERLSIKEYPPVLLESALELEKATDGFLNHTDETLEVEREISKMIDFLEEKKAKSAARESDPSPTPKRARKPRAKRAPKPRVAPQVRREPSEPSKPTQRAPKAVSAAERHLKAFVRLKDAQLTTDNILSRLRALQRDIWNGSIDTSDELASKVRALMKRYGDLYQSALRSRNSCTTITSGQLNGWGYSVDKEPELYGIKVKIKPEAARKLNRKNTEVHLWSERDRNTLELRHVKTQKTLAWWIDEELLELMEDGFLAVGSWKDNDPTAHETALAYFKYLTGADKEFELAGLGDKSAAQKVLNAYRISQGRVKSQTELHQMIARLQRAVRSGQIKESDPHYAGVAKVESILVATYNKALKAKCASMVPVDLSVFELKQARKSKAK
jgi:hypothetical protein